MDEADNNGSAPQSPDTASEHMIPKHRLDEVLSRLRMATEELAVKNELLNQARPQAKSGDDINFEELGLDPQLGNAVARLADKIAEKRVRAAGEVFQNHLAQVTNRTEESQFLIAHGAEKKKYLGKIHELRQHHWRSTGTALPMEAAYKLVVFDEMTTQLNKAKTPAAPAAQAAQGNAEPEAASLPDASQTRPMGSTPSQPAKNFSDMSFEDMEKLINSQIAQGSSI